MVLFHLALAEYRLATLIYKDCVELASYPGPSPEGPGYKASVEYKGYAYTGSDPYPHHL